MASFIIKKAEERGELKKGMKIIEATTGNTGISFAMISAIKGYKFTAVMPEFASIERKKIIKLFGGKIILTPAEKNIAGTIKKYKELTENVSDNVWLPKQFENPDNIEAHEKGTGKEIIKQMNRKVDAFVAGIGTGGTLIGTAKALKKINPKVKIIGVEPEESAVLSGRKIAKLHKIQGIGEGFIPKLVEDNRNLIDEVIQIKSSKAIEMQKKLIMKKGLLVGISSGANFLAAAQANKKYKKVVTVFPDRGERYLQDSGL